MISRGTLRRALRSSSVIILCLLGLTTAAQETEQPLAILMTTPRYRLGIDWLDANIIPHWFARYRTDTGGMGDTGESE